MIPGISAIAFDLDGTLYPNFSLNVRLAPFVLRHGRLLAAFGMARKQIRREQALKDSLLPNASAFYDYQARLCAERLGAEAEQMRRQIEKLIYRGWEAHFLKIRLFPHVRELLAELREKCFRLALLSDFPPQQKLENLGLAGLWDVVLCSEETGAIKPALRPFQVLAKELGCAPEQILYVGNSAPYDVFGARRAGMKTALFTKFHGGMAGGKTRADFTFSDYRKLRDFVLQ
jgi:putative hydrolase of the HAD superfamily